MPSSYIAIEFSADGPDAFEHAVARIDDVPATELILRRQRELPWYERQQLFGTELGCRVVIWVHDVLEQTEIGRADPQRDPYRKLDLVDVQLEVPARLAALIDELDGACEIVGRGVLRFTTRRYEADIRDQLIADVEAAAGGQARGEFGLERERLIGRIEGAILKVHEIERLVLRSGLVAADELFVDYV